MADSCFQDGESYLAAIERIGFFSPGDICDRVALIINLKFIGPCFNSTASLPVFYCSWLESVRFEASLKQNVWSRFSDPRTTFFFVLFFMKSSMCRRGVMDEHWDGCQRLGRTFHLPAMWPWCLGNLNDARYYSVFFRSGRWILTVRHTTLIFVYLKNLWDFHWTCFSLPPLFPRCLLFLQPFSSLHHMH